MTTVRDCHYPWTGFMILSNGYVNCCCYGSGPVGDISNAAPESVWNNATMQSLRASLAAGVLHTVCHSGTCKYVAGSGTTPELPRELASHPVDFDEAWYVLQYFDVADGVGRGRWSSGLDHYRRFGHREFRCRNADDWSRWVHEQEQLAREVGAGYEAALCWRDSPRLEGRTIVLSFSASNTGSLPWHLKGTALAPIHARVEAYRHVNDVDRVPPMYTYCAELTNPVAPGESLSWEMRTPVDDLPLGDSFLIIDLVSVADRIQLTNAPASSLVVGVHRDSDADQVELVSG